MRRIGAVLGLFLAAFVLTATLNPQFLSAYNLQNLLRWSALFGVPSLGVAFVIITGGIDLSIGSLIGLVGCLLPWLLVDNGWGAGPALVAVLLLSAAIGLGHGLFITRLNLQPFVVTLCGLLFYRGAARWLTNDQTLGFGGEHEGLRSLATGRPLALTTLLLLGGLALAAVQGWRARGLAREPSGDGPARRGARLGAVTGAVLAAVGAAALALDLGVLSSLRVPAPFLILLALAIVAGLFLNETVWGRHLFAVGRNEEAARHSGIRSDRMIVLAYVLCSLSAGLAGVLFALDVNSIQPATQGNFYELYAIAAAVLGGCSLRGGEASVVGVVVGAAAMRVLYNSINLLEIPTQLEFAIIGAVILAAVTADELVRRAVTARRGAYS